MPQPTPYVPEFSFTDFQASSPSAPLPGYRLDAELDGLETTLTGVLTNLGLIQRDDGKIANESIALDQLTPEVRAIIGGGTFRIRSEAWTAGLVFEVGDIFAYGEAAYLAMQEHVATDVAADVAAGRLAPMFDASRDVQEALDERPAALTWGARSTTRGLYEAERNVELLYQDVVGYAKDAGTTGGTGYSFYHAHIPDWDPDIPHTIGWALENIRQNKGWAIIDTRGFARMRVTDEQQLRFEVGENDCGIYVPARNLVFECDTLTGQMLIKNKNFILNGVSLRTLPGPKSGDYDGTGAKIEEGLCVVFPQNADKIAMMSCGLRGASDGALDVASTGFNGGVGQLCRMTVQQTQIWDTDEQSLIGSIEINPTQLTALADPRALLMTMYESPSLYCGQRTPKVLGRAFVDHVDSPCLILPFQRDAFKGGVSEFGSCRGPSVQGGGMLHTRGSLVTAAYGSGYNATELTPSPYTGVAGAIKVTDCGQDDCAAFQTANESMIPVVPYDLPHTPVPAAGPARDAYLATIIAKTGPYVDAAPHGVFVKKTDSSYPNGETVLYVRGQPTKRLLRIDPQDEIDSPAIDDAADSTFSTPRSYSRVVGFLEGKSTNAAIGANSLDIIALDSSDFAIQGTASPVDLSFIYSSAGDAIPDGLHLYLRASSSLNVNLKSRRTIAAVVLDIAANTLTVTGHGMSTGDFPISLTSTVAVPGGTVSSQQYWAIKVDNNTLKFALTRDDAMAGIAVDITSAGSGAHTALVGILNLPGGLDTLLDSSSKIAHLIYDTGTKAFGVVSKPMVKADVGLANVDNTSDATKPVSAAQAAAIALKADTADFAFGTYTPAIGATVNVAASSMNASTVAYWQRYKDQVTVTFEFNITPTAVADTQITFDKPVASNLGVTGDLCGYGNANDSTGPFGGPVLGVVATDLAFYRFKPTSIAARNHYITFRYRILP